MTSKAPVTGGPGHEPMRVLVLGAGVIGSVYASKLLQSGIR
jgi:hypothetical protein